MTDLVPLVLIVVMGACLLGMGWSAVMLRHSEAVYHCRMEVIERCRAEALRQLARGDLTFDVDAAYAPLDRVSYDEMMAKPWRAPESFFPEFFGK